MKCEEAAVSGVKILTPQIFTDSRGFFMETWNTARYAQWGIADTFVQDNLSLSAQGVLRGLHYQQPYSQGKLIYVLAGEVFDVAVDIRCGSPTFGRWVGITLSAENRQQLYIPPGFAHGFCVMSQTALFAYKCTDFYSPGHEKGICWNDPDLKIAWPVDEPILSDKDARYPRLRDIAVSNLASYQG